MRVEQSIDIDTAVQRVWDITLDVESWPKHTPTIESIERLDGGPLAIGSRARVKQPGQGSRVWTVSQLDPERRFAWWTRALGSTMTGIHLLEGSGATTTSTLAIEIEGPLAPIVGALVRRPIMAAITRENQGIKQASEAH